MNRFLIIVVVSCFVSSSSDLLAQQKPTTARKSRTIPATSPLEQRFSDCVGAILLLRRTHIQVANERAREALERAGEWLEAGAAPQDLVELEDQLVLAYVEAIDPEDLEVARSAVNRIHDPA